MGKIKLSQEFENNIIKKYISGSNFVKISKEFYISAKIIKRILKENNIYIRTHSESISGINNPFFNKKHKPESIELIKQNHADVSGKNNPNYSNHKLKGILKSETHKQHMKDSWINERKIFTEEHKEKLRKPKTLEHIQHLIENHADFSGKNNPNWQDGKTKLSAIIKNSPKYNTWRNLIFNRDNRICQDCGKSTNDIEAHHIKKFSLILKENNIKTFGDALLCDILWDLNNGITLCFECHIKTDNYGTLKGK